MTDSALSQLMLEAEIYARVILSWHSTIGVEMAPLRMEYEGRPREDDLQNYKSAIAHLMASDLSTTPAQAEIARLQVSGVFEWFYHEPIPVSLWAPYLNRLRSRLPERLNEAARQILSFHNQLKEVSAIDTSKEDAFNSGAKRGTQVHFSDRPKLVELARHYYSVYAQEEERGIGRVNFLLSCSLERGVETALDDGEITLLTAEYLGFKADTSEPDHFLNRLRSGEIRIEFAEGN